VIRPELFQQPQKTSLGTAAFRQQGKVRAGVSLLRNTVVHHVLRWVQWSYMVSFSPSQRRPTGMPLDVPRTVGTQNTKP
jgi:hypothetical protein